MRSDARIQAREAVKQRMALGHGAGCSEELWGDPLSEACDCGHREAVKALVSELAKVTPYGRHCLSPADEGDYCVKCGQRVPDREQVGAERPSECESWIGC